MRSSWLLSKSCAALLLTLAAASCSKVEGSEWVLGTYSNTEVNYSTLLLRDLARYEFRDDGTLIVTGVVNCGENYEYVAQEYEWRSDGDLRVIVEVPPPENAVIQEWVVTPGEECNTLQIVGIQDGRSVSGPMLYRGAVCMQDLPPCEDGKQCATCKTVWCDAPPPACEE